MTNNIITAGGGKNMEWFFRFGVGFMLSTCWDFCFFCVVF